jgi:hypothetical protein
MNALVPAILAAALMSPVVARAATPVATRNLDHSLAAVEAGVPALSPIDPLGRNGFVMNTVFGEGRWVYRFDGDASPPSNQAALSVPTFGLLNDDDPYSVDLIFQFESNQASRENILGVSNRHGDNAFHFSPVNKLQVWPTSTGPSTLTFGNYHRITLTNQGNGRVTA